MPRVSVIVPTGDRAVLLRRALAQLAAQTYTDFEVVIVDGGHRPVSSAIRNARYYRADPATTVGERRNIGIESARGELVAHVDDDDFYAPAYLADLVAWWDAHQPIDLGGVSTFWHYDVFRRRGWRSMIWDSGHPCGATYLYRKSLWKQLGGFPALQCGEDREFMNAVTANGDRMAALERPDLYVYLRHFRNVTGQVEPVYHPDWTKAARGVLGDAVHFYDDLAELAVLPTAAQEGRLFHLPPNLRTGH